jgi:signal transduction histidine kinase
MAIGSGRIARWWLDRRLRTKGLIVLALPMMVLIVTVVLSLVVDSHEVALRQKTLAVNSLANQSEQILTLLLNAESGVRGYALTHNQDFLQSYQQAVNQAPAAVAAWLQNAPGVIGKPEADNVASLVNNQLASLGSLQAGVADGTLSSADLNRQLLADESNMDSLRATLDNIQANEAATLGSRTDSVDFLHSVVETIDVAGIGIGVIGGITAMVLFVRAIVRRIGVVSANAHRLGVSEPLVSMPPAKDEIGELGSELEEASTLLTQRNKDLVRFHAAAVDAAQGADDLLGQISHELRTPLTAVMGFGRLMEMSELSEQDSESVGQILHAGGHMLEIVEKARHSPSAPQAIELAIRPVEVGALVAEVLSLLQPLAAARNLTMIGCDGRSVPVLADYQRLKQVLINLGSNAVKFNREGGKIEVTCDPAGPGLIRIAVTDSGDGIPADMLDRVFVPFDRLDAEKRGVEGTGIGLTLSKTFVEAMGGTIGVESTVGKGSMFWVELPAAPRPDGSPAKLSG